MSSDQEIRTLLAEIRDVEREHLAEYRRVTQQLLEVQNRALDRQQQIARLYRRVLVGAGSLVALLVVLLAYLLVRWSHLLFRR